MGTPVIKNDVLHLKIEDMSIDGEGIGKVEGYTLFVKDAIIGDEIEAKVIKAKKNYGYARLMKVLKPSSYRTEPICPIARQCGGCQLQALSYEKQLEFKQNKIKHNLESIGKCKDFELLPIIGMEHPFAYRNKAQYPVRYDKEGNIVMGFFAGRTHDVIETKKCYLGVEENEAVLEAVKLYMLENKVTAYDEKAHKGLVRHILIRKGFSSGQLMVCLIINGNSLPAKEKLIEKLVQIEGMTSISFNINREKGNTILGRECITIYGQSTIVDSIQGVSFDISPQSFFQVNPIQTQILYSNALRFAGLTGTETVWDLYCGIGTISLFLARQAFQVYGIEIIPQAIDNARNNANRNGIDNVEFFVGKAEEILPNYYEKEKLAGRNTKADVIVVDPPRKGCAPELLDTIVKIEPERVVYVSCDSATLARDVRYMEERGYELVKVQGVDMFPNTTHVETVVLLSKLRPDDYVEVDLELDELDLTSAEKKATYQKIKDYVLDKYGVKVHTRYIAEVKRMCGIEMGENYNKSKKEEPEVKHCPQEKVEYIVDALRYYLMI